MYLNFIYKEVYKNFYYFFNWKFKENKYKKCKKSKIKQKLVK